MSQKNFIIISFSLLIILVSAMVGGIIHLGMRTEEVQVKKTEEKKTVKTLTEEEKRLEFLKKYASTTVKDSATEEKERQELLKKYGSVENDDAQTEEKKRQEFLEKYDNK